MQKITRHDHAHGMRINANNYKMMSGKNMTTKMWENWAVEFLVKMFEMAEQK